MIPISKVVPVELDDGLVPLAIEPRYTTAHLVVRWHGRVVGQVVVPGLAVVPVELQRAAIVRQLGDLLWDAELDRLLAEAIGPAEVPSVRVSVVVCTRDRPDDLARCLAAIGALEPRPAEVIVVDSASREPDAVRAVAAQAGAQVVREDVPGAARARNRGILVSSGDAIAFTDDDCEPDPRWLGRVAAELADGRVAAVTGVVVPLELETAAQWLFEAHGGFRRGFRRRVVDGAVTSPTTAAGVLGVSANLVVRRASLERAGLFAERFGPGTPARAGEDYELFARLLDGGERIVFDPAQVVRHRHRRGLVELRRTLRGYGVSSTAFATHRLLAARDPGALRVFGWWWGRHLPGDLRDVVAGRQGRLPLGLLAAELVGTFEGPAALRRARRVARATPELVLPAVADPSGGGVTVVAEAPSGLSVVVPTSGRAGPLACLLQALAAQSFPAARIETVVVLDGPSEACRATIAAHGGARVVVREIARSGVGAARNAGVSAASEPVVVFLDDDVVPDADCLAAHAAAHGDGRERVVLGYAPPVVDGSLWSLTLRAWWEDHFTRKRARGAHLRWSDVVTLDSSFPRRLLERERFDPSFTERHEDWELGVRLVEQGVELSYAPQARARHHLDCSFAGAVARQGAEARADVALALLHPAVAPELPLAGHLGRAGRPAPVTRGRLARVARLERLGLRSAWRREALRLLDDAYAAGLRDALASPGAWEGFAELVRSQSVEPVELRLGEAAGPPQLPPFGAVELVVTVAGERVARVAPAPPGAPWGWPEAAARVRRHASDAIREAVVARDLGLEAHAPEVLDDVA